MAPSLATSGKFAEENGIGSENSLDRCDPIISAVNRPTLRSNRRIGIFQAALT
jgi:hypothetical protein